MKIALNIGSAMLPQANCTKFLGVWIDQNLDWNEHITRHVLKLKQNQNLLKTTKNLLSNNVKKTIYYAHIYSHLKYGVAIWGPMLNKGQLTKLKKIQNESMHLITNTKLPTMNAQSS